MYMYTVYMLANSLRLSGNLPYADQISYNKFFNTYTDQFWEIFSSFCGWNNRTDLYTMFQEGEKKKNEQSSSFFLGWHLCYIQPILWSS